MSPITIQFSKQRLQLDMTNFNSSERKALLINLREKEILHIEANIASFCSSFLCKFSNLKMKGGLITCVFSYIFDPYCISWKFLCK